MQLNLDVLVQSVVSSMVFTAIGLVLFAFAYLVMEKLTPFSLKKDLIEDQNVALGIVIAALIIGIAMIVSAAMHG